MSNADTNPDTLGINMHISTPVAYILSGAAIYRELFGVSVSDATQNCQFGEQPLLGYARPFRTLNGELLHHSRLRRLFVVRQAPFLTGSSQGLALNAKSLNAPQTDSSASANSRHVHKSDAEGTVPNADKNK